MSDLSSRMTLIEGHIRHHLRVIRGEAEGDFGYSLDLLVLIRRLLPDPPSMASEEYLNLATGLIRPAMILELSFVPPREKVQQFRQRIAEAHQSVDRLLSLRPSKHEDLGCENWVEIRDQLEKFPETG